MEGQTARKECMALTSPLRLLKFIGYVAALAVLAGCTIPGNQAVPSPVAESAPAPRPATATPSATPTPIPGPSTTGPIMGVSATPTSVAPTPVAPSTPPPTFGPYRTASWASTFKVTGAPLFSVQKSGLRVDAYKAGTATTLKNSGWLDAKTKKDVWPKGNPVVYLVYVITNTSSKPVYIDQRGVTAEVRLASMNYAGGVGGLIAFNSSQAAKFSVKQTMMRQPPRNKNSRPQLRAGESAATSQSLPWKKDEPYIFTLKLPTYAQSIATDASAKEVSFPEADSPIP